MNDENTTLAVIGLGYVGLPLAVEFSKVMNVIGFDIDQSRVDALKSGNDKTLEISNEELLNAKRLRFTCNTSDLSEARYYVITVPTPVDDRKEPDLTPLLKASEMVGGVLKSGDIVIYESTVYPGATEEDCVPILESASGLRFNKDFFVGYSPERINPGDKSNKLTTIMKITSGSNDETAETVDRLYKEIISAGTFRAASIRVAEAAKVIENTQRDINIAIVNEFSKIFNVMGIDTEDVLSAARTKWNFLPFSPGLVGGHCIGVDPYYLAHKSESLGYRPNLLLESRKINDGMGIYVVDQLIKEMAKKEIQLAGARVLILGLSFKENCPDLRNTRVVDIVNGLKNSGVLVDVYDPWVNSGEALRETGISLLSEIGEKEYDAAIVAVRHQQFIADAKELYLSAMKDVAVIYDLKHAWSRDVVDIRL